MRKDHRLNYMGGKSNLFISANIFSAVVKRSFYCKLREKPTKHVLMFKH